jgi:hypothetical protein
VRQLARQPVTPRAAIQTNDLVKISGRATVAPPAGPPLSGVRFGWLRLRSPPFPLNQDSFLRGRPKRSRARVLCAFIEVLQLRDEDP